MILCNVREVVPVPRLLPELEGLAILQVETEDGNRLLAADRLGAELGNRVLVTLGENAQALAGAKTPLDAAVVGIVKG